MDLLQVNEELAALGIDDGNNERPQAALERVLLESNVDEDDGEPSNSTDTTAAEARRGKDIQGIPWSRLKFTRETYRERRLQLYRNYENLNQPHGELEKECKSPMKGGEFYQFRYNTRAVKSTYFHFQLRNLVWATSKHDVYLMHGFSFMHWSSLTRKATEVLNVREPVVPTSEVMESVKTPSARSPERIQISTMCVKNNLLVGGGFQGEMVCKFLDRPGVSYCAKITHDENAVTNAIEIYDSASHELGKLGILLEQAELCKESLSSVIRSGQTRLMSSSNDSVVRVFDCDSFSVLSKFDFPWSVNHTSVSPDSNKVIVVGDKMTIAKLVGHLDYSFASAWHPNGHTFATGNQDTTCRVWDARMLSRSVAVLKGRMAAIRSIRFTADGRFMAMAEPADFVHIFDTKQDYNQCQETDIFGEVAGISFSPDTEALFVGVTDRTYGSLLEFNRSHTNT